MGRLYRELTRRVRFWKEALWRPGWGLVLILWSLFANATTFRDQFFNSDFQQRWSTLKMLPELSGQTWLIGILLILWVVTLEGSYRAWAKESSTLEQANEKIRRIEGRLGQSQRSNTLRYEERFGSQKVKTARRRAANFLLSGAGDPDSLEDVLDFWEDIGQDWANGNLDEARVHNSFFYWIHGWLQIAKPYIESYRQKESDEKVWGYAVRLYGRVVEMQQQKVPEFHIEMSEDTRKTFLQQEARL